MSDTDLGATLSPQEQSYFDSGGSTEIPAGEKVAEQEVKTEVKPEPEAKEEPKVEKMVSLAALHEERTRRKQIDAQFRQTQQELAELRGKFSIVERLAPGPEAQKAPTVEDDIFGYAKKTGDTVAELQARLDKQDNETKTQREAQKAHDDLVTAYRSDAAQFRTEAPDFDAAYNHLLKSRADELQAIGYNSPQALHQALIADEQAIAQMALSEGKSPAKVIYELAKLRGYSKQAKKPDAAEKIDAIEKGQQENKSLAGTGGAGGDADMTAETLLKMPMDEFESWCNKNPAKAKRMLGG